MNLDEDKNSCGRALASDELLNIGGRTYKSRHINIWVCPSITSSKLYIWRLGLDQDCKWNIMFQAASKKKQKTSQSMKKQGLALIIFTFTFIFYISWFLTWSLFHHWVAYMAGGTLRVFICFWGRSQVFFSYSFPVFYLIHLLIILCIFDLLEMDWWTQQGDS